jgi:hypothetical protein
MDMNKPRVTPSTRTVRGIYHLQKQLEQLRKLRQTETDKRGLIAKAVKLIIGPPDPGEHTEAVLDRLEGFIELEIDAKWAEYLKHKRQEMTSADFEDLP